MSQGHEAGLRPGDRLAGFPFDEHNQEVRAAWSAYNAGAPTRVPIVLGTNSRFFLFSSEANPEGIDFQRYSEDPDVMLEAQLRFQRWSRYNLLQDGELGLPERWGVYVDFQIYYEAAWFGCPVVYRPGEVPDTRPAFANCPERVMEGGLPDPFGGLMAKGLEFYEHLTSRVKDEDYLGRPISVSAPGMGTDGVMTVACNLFGPVFVCTAMSEEPDRLRRLFEFITEATIHRMSAWRERLGIPFPTDGFGAADDSIALISTKMYREHVLPHHKRLYRAFGTEAPGAIHLCGDSTRHFLALRDELNVWTFDTGFPVDFGALRRQLGPRVRILGGPHVDLLRSGTPAQVRDEVARILSSGILEGGLFVLREGNNLAPGTPLPNTEAMYHAGRELGRLTA
ncbi:MAG TPA: uroporphyrinogen decarboxylase family protein [Armatimonadota bacterium]